MIKNPALLIFIGITLINSAEQTQIQLTTVPTKEEVHNRGNSVKEQTHEYRKQIITYKTSSLSDDKKDISTVLNSTNARRFQFHETFTRPDISDRSFQSLLDEYRALVKTTGSIYEDDFNYQNVERFNAQAKLNHENGEENYHTMKILMNVNNHKTAKVHVGTTMQHLKLPKPSISALVTGRVPKWMNLGRDGDEDTTAITELLSPETMVTSTTQTTTTRKRRRRTSPYRISMIEDCDYNAYYCLKAFYTGPVCGKTLYMTTHTFKNYCMLDFVNCIERTEAWIPMYLGECFDMGILSEYKQYHYKFDNWYKNYYVADDL